MAWGWRNNTPTLALHTLVEYIAGGLEEYYSHPSSTYTGWIYGLGLEEYYSHLSFTYTGWINSWGLEGFKLRDRFADRVGSGVNVRDLQISTRNSSLLFLSFRFAHHPTLTPPTLLPFLHLLSLAKLHRFLTQGWLGLGFYFRGIWIFKNQLYKSN